MLTPVSEVGERMKFERAWGTTCWAIGQHWPSPVSEGLWTMKHHCFDCYGRLSRDSIREMFCKLKKIITPDVISRASKQRGTKEEESGFKFKIKCVSKCPLMYTYMSKANLS